MTEATQPRVARGTTLIGGVVVAALIALLAFAPVASATPDPVASGSTVVTLNNGWTKYLKTFGIKIQKISPAKLKGQKATFTVTGGEMDPTNGLGTLNLGGGLKFKAGKKSTTVKSLVLSSATNTLTAKVGGKKVKLAKTSGLTFTRNGFGVNVTLKKLKLNSAGANQLNKKLGFAKGKPKPFLANKLIGKSTSEDQPSTVAVLPANNLVYTGDPTLLKKLEDVKTAVELISPTTQAANVFTSPITGGTISPTATAGTVMSSGGLKLNQTLSASVATKITLGAFYVDLAAKTVTVEVAAESTASKSLNLGNLGRSSIADLSLTGATVTADPTTRTVTVQNATATLQPVSAEVLDGFVKVYQGAVEATVVAEVCKLLPGKCEVDPEKEKAEAATIGESKAKGEAAVAGKHIASGEALGTFSFTAQGQ
jgi:hypothetical protein